MPNYLAYLAFIQSSIFLILQILGQQQHLIITSTRALLEDAGVDTPTLTAVIQGLKKHLPHRTKPRAPQMGQRISQEWLSSLDIDQCRWFFR
jgi:hypothetical protein